MLAIITIIGEIFPKLMSRFGGTLESFIKIGPQPESGSEAVSEQGIGKKFLIICAWIAGFFLLVFLVGFLIAVPVFFITFLKVRARIGWLRTIAVAMVVG